MITLTAIQLDELAKALTEFNDELPWQVNTLDGNHAKQFQTILNKHGIDLAPKDSQVVRCQSGYAIIKS